ncbi:AAA family ATPase [Solwaraspora sp. WMMB335]|uniref:AAA family ATPase n=1 Tax=Solwaraspora sp. WMMB335 TaxID=3404118 RepID=UPI003B94D355
MLIPVVGEPISREPAQRPDGVVWRIEEAVAGAVLGKPDAVRLALTALLAEGHLLIEDVPGVGKTTLARAMAAVVEGACRRIQFTPDLMPSDVTGLTLFDQAAGEFEFHPGPVFANVVIADEINRASAKTQSALLEVMEEGSVTVDGISHPVPRPFLVVATQNPVDLDGTYRLPGAQLDRFLMRISVGYPDEDTEVEVARGAAAGRPVRDCPPVADMRTLRELIKLTGRIHVADPLYRYAVRLAAATRAHPQVRVGVSPRGVIALTRAARAYAHLAGRGYVLPEDVKALVEPVFAHRLTLTQDARAREVSPTTVLRTVAENVPAPVPVRT